MCFPNSTGSGIFFLLYMVYPLGLFSEEYSLGFVLLETMLVVR